MFVIDIKINGIIVRNKRDVNKNVKKIAQIIHNLNHRNKSMQV